MSKTALDVALDAIRATDPHPPLTNRYQAEAVVDALTDLEWLPEDVVWTDAVNAVADELRRLDGKPRCARVRAEVAVAVLRDRGWLS